MSLEDRLESGLPSAWRPDQEDPALIVGEVVDLQVATSDYAPYPLIVIRQDDGEEKAIHGFHTVLRNELLKNKPQIGERIGIKYLGEQATKPGSKFKSFIGYRVSMERPAAPFDWNTIGQEEPVDEALAVPEQEPVSVPAGAGDDDIPF